MIPLAVPNITGNERKYLNECVDTAFVSSVGGFVNRMEEMTAEKSGTRYGVATSSGTTGLHLALTGCGVKRDELVIIPTFTFIATANAVAYCGAVPWMLDISPESWCLDAGQLEMELEKKSVWKDRKLIHKETGQRIAAIMPVYTLGNIPDMDWIQDIASRYRLPLIADAAAALGAEYGERKSGQCADVTVFSFNGNKTVTAGGGGMAVGDDEELMKRLKHLSTTARVTAEYDHDMVGFNYRMTNIQAAVGCAQLERIEEFVKKKRSIRAFYSNAFRGIGDISSFPEHDTGKSACWFSGIVLKQGGLSEIRKISGKLRDAGIESRSFWKPVHLQRPYENAVRAGSLEVAENLWDRILTLPCSTGITADELEYVADVVKNILV